MLRVRRNGPKTLQVVQMVLKAPGVATTLATMAVVVTEALVAGAGQAVAAAGV